MILNKLDFRDALCLRNGYRLDGLPIICVCGKDLNNDRAFTDLVGRYATAHHNELCNNLPEVMREVVTDVEM